ncbi:CAMK family protein kinase [Histomonas meleagridis]|uniref:CAMK family protein kinase n=1 Tax=Histomonas meleagridis TaxID=135588 RepID=UPI00355AC393|nr:CAMK family protein kinase [Histomonas meleagridis]KAH0800712.1 CAMK family protein kinase [Histomonas meleagridis]
MKCKRKRTANKNDPTRKKYFGMNGIQKNITFIAKISSKTNNEYAEVYSAFDFGTKVAIKLVKNESRLAEQFENECAALEMCNSEFVIKIHERIISEDQTYLGIIMDFMENNLFQYVQNTKNEINEFQARQIISQVLSGIKYIHSIGIIHPDISPFNILITVDLWGTPQVCITGFSLAAKPNKEGTVHGQYGNKCFWAPEIVLNRPFSYSANIWSAGIVAFYVLTRHVPYDQAEENRMFSQILTRIEFLPCFVMNPTLNFMQKDLIMRMMQIEPGDRLSAEQALNHKWLEGFPVKANTAETLSFIFTTVEVPFGQNPFSSSTNSDNDFDYDTYT